MPGKPPSPLAIAQHKLEEAGRLQREATKIIQDEQRKKRESADRDPEGVKKPGL